MQLNPSDAESHRLRCALLALAFVLGCRSTYRAQALDERAIAAHLDAGLEVPAPLASPSFERLSRDCRPESTGEPISLTLWQAQTVGLIRHPRLERLRAERGFADAADVRAKTRPDPELSLTALWISPQAVLGGVAALRWELLPSGTREARRGLAGSMRTSIDARVAAEEWRIAQAARVAWLGVAKDERALALAERSAALALDTREFGRSMLESGATTETEGAVLDLALGEAEREVVARRGALVSGRVRLAEALGLPSSVVVLPLAEGDPLEPAEPAVPAGTTDDLLLTRLPDLRESRAGYDLAEHELELAHLGALPKFFVGPDAQRDADSTFLGGGGSVTLPIHDGNRAGIAEAATRRRIAALTFQETLFEARAAVSDARAAEEAAANSLTVHEQSVAPLAAAALSTAQRAVDAGAADLLTLLLARQRALEAERVELDLRAAHAIAAARLEAAFGPEPAPPREQP